MRWVMGGWLLALGVAVAGMAQAAAPTLPRVVAYDFGASPVSGETESTPWHQIPAAQARELDTVIFAFSWVRDGRVVISKTGAKRLDSLVALKQVNPDLKVVLSVGGWGAGGFSEAASTAGGRALFAKSATKLVVDHHLDGLDVDWEFPGSSESGITASSDDEANFTLLLKETRSTLAAAGAADGHAYTLSIAAGVGADLRGTNIAAVNQYLDWFNVMTYDQCNKEPPGVHITCHHSGLHTTPTTPVFMDTLDRAAWQFLMAGVPAGKLVMGAAFYAHVYRGVNAANDGLFQPYSEAPGSGDSAWPRIKADFVNQNGFVRHWDPIAKAATLWNAKTHTFVTYDDPESLTAKAAYVKANHLGGITFWHLGLDPSGELLHAIAQGLHAAGAQAQGMDEK